MDDLSKTLNLKSFDIVILNYVEESRKGELINELKALYGEYQPLEVGVASVLWESHIDPPDPQSNKKILFYDEVGNLKKPLIDKIQSLEIRIVSHLAGWCVVICKGRLKHEYLEQAKQEFTDRLEKSNTVRTPDIFERAHQEFEGYLAPYIMDNIIHNHDSEKRRSYPFLYVGEVGELSSQKLTDIIEATDFTRDGIGWFALRWASIFERSYLIARTGGRQSGILLQDRGLSILNIAPVTEGKSPDSWDQNTRRRFRAIGFEYQVIDRILLMQLPYVVLKHRIESMKSWEQRNISLSHKIREVSTSYKEGSKGFEGYLAASQQDIERHRSEFIVVAFEIKNECEELSDVIKSSYEILSSTYDRNAQTEEPFFHPVKVETQIKEDFLRRGNPKQGVITGMIKDAQLKNDQLLNMITKIEEGQTTLSAYMHDVVNTSLQGRLERFTKRIMYLTCALIVLAVIQAALLVISIFWPHIVPGK